MKVINPWILGVILFFIDFVVDFAWSMYIKRLADNKFGEAAGWSAFISLAGGITVIGYTTNHWLLIPAVVGGAIGTYCSRYFNKNQSDLNNQN